MLGDPDDLERFVTAQKGVFELAISELRAGRKESHWMWFIFPQLAGLGRSTAAQFFGIHSNAEAGAYLAHALLGPRLLQSVDVILPWADKRTPEQIFGSVDAMKFRSSMTLFDHAAPGRVFGEALTRFFAKPDERTLALLQQSA